MYDVVCGGRACASTGVCDEGGERRRAFDDDNNEMGPLVCTTLAVYDDGAQRRSRFGGVGRRRFQRVDRCTTTVMTMNGGQCTMIGAFDDGDDDGGWIILSVSSQ